MAKAAKKAAKKSAAPNTIKWSTPGGATSTVFLTDRATFTALYVSLMPGFNYENARKALIGDSVTSDDFMDVNHFESYFERAEPSARFITATFVNKSPASKTFELAFVFGGDDTEQRITYTLASNASLTDYIDVTLVR